jgi:hypothetical protein
MAQVVECLTNMPKALNSNSGTAKKKKKRSNTIKSKCTLNVYFNLFVILYEKYSSILKRI